MRGWDEGKVKVGLYIYLPTGRALYIEHRDLGRLPNRLVERLLERQYSMRVSVCSVGIQLEFVRKMGFLISGICCSCAAHARPTFVTVAVAFL